MQNLGKNRQQKVAIDGLDCQRRTDLQNIVIRAVRADQDPVIPHPVADIARQFRCRRRPVGG